MGRIFNPTIKPINGQGWRFDFLFGYIFFQDLKNRWRGHVINTKASDKRCHNELSLIRNNSAGCPVFLISNGLRRNHPFAKRVMPERPHKCYDSASFSDNILKALAFACLKKIVGGWRTANHWHKLSFSKIREPLLIEYNLWIKNVYDPNEFSRLANRARNRLNSKLTYNRIMKVPEIRIRTPDPRIFMNEIRQNE